VSNRISVAEQTTPTCPDEEAASSHENVSVGALLLSETNTVSTKAIRGPMKQFALLYFALSITLATLAQQPAEWRPNIAEDNKAATYEQTIQFLRVSLDRDSTFPFRSEDSDRCRMKFVSSRPFKHALGFAWTIGAGWSNFNYSLVGDRLMKLDDRVWEMQKGPDQIEIKPGTSVTLIISRPGQSGRLTLGGNVDRMDVGPSRFMLESSHHGLEHSYEFTGFQNQTECSADLSAIDPLSISVTPNDTQGAGQSVYAESSYKLVLLSCSESPQRGTTPAIVSSKVIFAISDIEMSKRLARALQHAALLCGGKNAVSPF
jgi:hypothetical protein